MPVVVVGLIAAGGAYAGWWSRDKLAAVIPGADDDFGQLAKLLAAAGLAGVAVGWWYGRK